MSLIYQLSVTAPAADLNATGIKLVLPVCESLQIVEYGLYASALDPSGAVVKLQYVDGATSPNTVDLDTLTVPAAPLAGDLVSRRVDVLLDRLLDKFLVSIEGTPGTITSEPDGIIACQLNLTTVATVGAGAQGTLYIKYALAGTMKTAGTSQTIV
jgi:hypothetical protein